MLTDIFAARYGQVQIFERFEEPERRLLVQCFRIVAEQIHPYWAADGKERDGALEIWKSMHDKLSMELGMQELSARGFWRQVTWAGSTNQQWQSLGWLHVCQNFVTQAYDPRISADRFIKERLSFIEIAFRERELFISELNKSLEQRIAEAREKATRPTSPGTIRVSTGIDIGELMRTASDNVNRTFRDHIHELNERFRQAGIKLNYHNGFIQIAEDPLVERQIETPFWSMVSAPMWTNVDTDLKEAIDRRDGNQRDPAFYAARSLESAIKIISAHYGWTRGNERGASAYIDNLQAAANGRFITSWEADLLKRFFADVRNELGHGPGDSPMPELSLQQTSWAIEFCMSWIKSLISRM